MATNDNTIIISPKSVVYNYNDKIDVKYTKEDILSYEQYKNFIIDRYSENMTKQVISIYANGDKERANKLFPGFSEKYGSLIDSCYENEEINISKEDFNNIKKDFKENGIENLINNQYPHGIDVTLQSVYNNYKSKVENWEDYKYLQDKEFINSNISDFNEFQKYGYGNKEIEKAPATIKSNVIRHEFANTEIPVITSNCTLSLQDYQAVETANNIRALSQKYIAMCKTEEGRKEVDAIIPGFSKRYKDKIIQNNTASMVTAEDMSAIKEEVAKVFSKQYPDFADKIKERWQQERQEKNITTEITLTDRQFCFLTEGAFPKPECEDICAYNRKYWNNFADKIELVAQRNKAMTEFENINKMDENIADKYPAQNKQEIPVSMIIAKRDLTNE